MGKPVQISKCQLRINTFQLRCMRAAAGGGGVTQALSSLRSPLGFDHTAHRIHKHIREWKHPIMQQLVIENTLELKGRLWDVSMRWQIVKNNLSVVFKCLSVDVGSDPEDDSSKQSSTSLYSHNLLMCGGGDDDDCSWLPVITAPPAHMSLLSQQMMGHLCLTGGNRHRWTFSDPSPNYTLRTWEETIKKDPLRSALSNSRPPVCCWTVRYVAAVVLKTWPAKSQDEKISYSLETHRPWRSQLKPLGFWRGRQSVWGFMSTGGGSVGLMQMRSF